jgi:tetratricopeptide (TPR) repeat protein
MEWAALSSSESAPAAAPSAADSIAEEIEFYLQASLLSDAETALSRLRQEFTSHPSIADFEARLHGSAPVEEAEGRVAEHVIPAGESLTTDFPMVAGDQPTVEAPLREEAVQAQKPEAEPGAFLEPAPSVSAKEHDLVLEDMLAPSGSSSGHSAFELSLDVAETPPAPSAAPRQDKFADLAGALGDMLGEGPSPPPKAAPPPRPPAGAPAQPVQAAAAAGPPSGGLLDDVFAEFRDEMDEPGGDTGDIETHYNMGIAFKEMALYDEAIGEFQKAHHLAEQARDTSHLVQCCSLLATCFLEKGLPLLAVRWYQTALGAPGLDPESSLALLYETGSAYETAGDKAAALKSFMEVYARNIDYRNVSDRIRDLQ